MKFWKKEKKVVQLLSRHVEAVQLTLGASRSAFMAYLDGGCEVDHRLNEETDRLEAEADALRREIQNTLYAGAFLPRLRGDIYRLVQSIDNIADSAETCADFISTQAPSVPEEFAGAFRELADIVFATYEPMQDAVKTYLRPKGKLDEVRQHCALVSKMESEVDQVEEALISRIFDSDLDLARKMHLQRFIHALTRPSDRTEDAADLLEQVGIKSVV